MREHEEEPARPDILSKMDELLRYLPQLSEPGRVFIVRWAGGETDAGGAMQFPYPIYADDVSEFFQVAGGHFWSDYGYDPRTARAMLADDGLVARADLEQIKTMLTYCVRGERFCDGHWGALLESGRVQALLRRLAELREPVG
jgi:hypothetical protein